MQNIFILCCQCKAATADPETIHIVCGTLVIIAAIIAAVFIFRHLFDLIASACKAKREREWKVQDTIREQNAEYRKLILEFTKDPYLEKDRKFNTEATKVDDKHPYIATLLSYIEKPSQNN